MSSSLDAVIRAIDALEEPALKRREPQGTTGDAPMATAKLLES
jgi:hypothetical protein